MTRRMPRHLVPARCLIPTTADGPRPDCSDSRVTACQAPAAAPCKCILVRSAATNTRCAAVACLASTQGHAPTLQTAAGRRTAAAGCTLQGMSLDDRRGTKRKLASELVDSPCQDLDALAVEAEVRCGYAPHALRAPPATCGPGVTSVSRPLWQAGKAADATARPVSSLAHRLKCIELYHMLGCSATGCVWRERCACCSTPQSQDAHAPAPDVHDRSRP